MLKMECIICSNDAYDLYYGEPCCYKKECMTTIEEAESDREWE